MTNPCNFVPQSGIFKSLCKSVKSLDRLLVCPCKFLCTTIKFIACIIVKLIICAIIFLFFIFAGLYIYAACNTATQNEFLQTIHKLGSCDEFFTLLACIISSIAAYFLYHTLKSQRNTTERETFMRMVDSFERYVELGQTKYFDRRKSKMDNVLVTICNLINGDRSKADLFEYMLEQLKSAKQSSADDKRLWEKLQKENNKEKISDCEMNFFKDTYNKVIHKEYRDFLSAYFRQIYHIIKFAEKYLDKKSCENLLEWFRSKFSDYARAILMYNSICDHAKNGDDEFELHKYLRDKGFYKQAEKAFPSVQEEIMNFNPEKK